MPILRKHEAVLAEADRVLAEEDAAAEAALAAAQQITPEEPVETARVG